MTLEMTLALASSSEQSENIRNFARNELAGRQGYFSPDSRNANWSCYVYVDTDTFVVIGVHDAEVTTTVSAGISAADHRARAWRTIAVVDRTRVRADRAMYSELGPPSGSR